MINKKIMEESQLWSEFILSCIWQYIYALHTRYDNVLCRSVGTIKLIPLNVQFGPQCKALVMLHPECYDKMQTTRCMTVHPNEPLLEAGPIARARRLS